MLSQTRFVTAWLQAVISLASLIAGRYATECRIYDSMIVSLIHPHPAISLPSHMPCSCGAASGVFRGRAPGISTVYDWAGVMWLRDMRYALCVMA